MRCADKMRRCKAAKSCVPSVIHDVNVSFSRPVGLAGRLIQAGTVSFHVGVFSPGGDPSFRQHLCSIEEQIYYNGVK